MCLEQETLKSGTNSLKIEDCEKSPDPYNNNLETLNQDKSINIKRSFWTLYGGILMALLASVFFSSCFLIIKTLGHDTGGNGGSIKGFGAALLLNIGVLVPSVVIIFYNDFGPFSKRREKILRGTQILSISGNALLGYMIIQGTLQGISVILRSLSLGYLSVGDMTVIVFSSPVMTGLLAHFLLGEKCGISFLLVAILTLGGVGLITKPPIFTGAESFDTLHMIGTAFAAGAMLSLSMKFVVTRKIKKAHFLVMTFFLGLTGVLISLPLFLVFESPETLLPKTVTGLLLRLGLFAGFGAVSCINLALKMEDAGVVALVRSCDVIFAFLLQYLFLGVVPDLLSAIGATLVWTGVLIAGMQKYWNNKTQSSSKNDEKNASTVTV